MTYTFKHFANDKPVGADDIEDVMEDMRENLLAINVALAYGGTLPNWNYTQFIGIGTISRPQNHFYTYVFDERIKIRLQNSWIDIDGFERLAQVQYAFTLDNGENWHTFAIKALGYTDGIVTTTTWIIS